ncbi:MAG: N-acetyltransferase family protein [Phycisphaerales bacterium]
MIVRDAREADLPAIFEIYHEQVLHGTATFDTEPKGPEAQREWLLAHPRERYPVIAAEEMGRVVGWARLHPWSERCAYRRSAENSVYVHPQWRGRGVGRLLLTELIDRARRAGVAVLLARIAEGNPASIALHERAGFERIGTMRRVGEKFGRVLDVELMQMHLDGAGGAA